MDESLSKSSYHSYEVYEEECVETLSDDDNQHYLEFTHHYNINHNNNHNNNHTQYVEEEVFVGDDDVDEVEYVEEEILESTFHTRSLPGISEGDDENDDREDEDDEVVEEVVLTDNDDDDDDDDDDDEYDEVEVHMNGSQSIHSGSEVEILETDDDDDYDDDGYDGPDSTAYEEEVLIEEYYDDDDEHDDHDEIEVIHHHDNENDHHHHEKIITTTTRRVSDESQNDNRLERSLRKNRSLSGRNNFNNSNNNNTAKSSFRTTAIPTPTADIDELVEVENDDNIDGASAEELTEAIEYVLRQERAVSKFILTEEQAQKMAHLPIPVMKIIVDHLEICDNEEQPIDWDFLLKIVCPYCDE